MLDGISSSSQIKPRFNLKTHIKRRNLALFFGLVTIILILITVIYKLSPNHIKFISQIKPFIKPGTYLVLFQNDAELRPAGGFIGSFALVSVLPNYQFTYSIETNIYKLDLAFSERNPIEPPEPLKGITENWALRDSNWAIDFGQAAQTVEDFLYKETGVKVDGVIAITARSVQALLAQVGALKMDNETKLTADNFYNTLHFKIEKEYFFDSENRTQNEPKQIIANLAPQFINRISMPWNWLKVVNWLNNQLIQKQILVYFNDDREQIAENYGWTGRINGKSQHYLALNNANLGGLKSSLSMSQAVELSIKSEEQNKAIYQLILKRTHHGSSVWPDHKNDNLTRIVLPQGAKVENITLDNQSTPIVVQEETGKRTVFGVRFDTDPGTTKTLYASFLVPVDPNLESSFTYQKQPGIVSDKVKVIYNDRVFIDREVDRDVKLETRN